MSSADDALSKYTFTLSMLRGVPTHRVSSFEKDLEALKRDQQDSRSKYFQMDKLRNSFISEKSSFSGVGDMDDDAYTRSLNLDNINQ